MSKFIDKLTRLAKGESQGMGFTARQSSGAKPRIQLVARLAAESVDGLASRAAGADFGIIDISSAGNGVEAVSKLCKSQPDIVWGGRVNQGTPEEMKQLTGAGCDFIVFTSETSVTIMRDEKSAGKILELESGITEGMIRIAGELPVDAVLMDGGLEKSQALSWQQMMIFTRFSSMLAKPLLVPVPSGVTVAELQALWEAGINAVVIKIEAGQPEDLLSRLKQEVDKADFTSRRSRRGEALLSRSGQPPAGKVSADDDDDD